MHKKDARRLLEALSKREMEVLGYLSQGHGTSEAAALLGVTPKTLGTHVQNILRKTGLRSRLHAVLTYLRTR